MLDLGFLPDLERLLARPRPTGKRCCSRPPCRLPWSRWPGATSHPDPHPCLGAGRHRATSRPTAQFVFRAHAMDKVEVLARILRPATGA